MPMHKHTIDQHFVLPLLATRAFTYVVGQLAKSPLSRWIIPIYLLLYKINPADAEKPWQQYRSFVEFFSRKLQTGARMMPDEQGLVLSPVDGLVMEIGTIKEGKALQAKGVTYALEELLTEGAENFAEGDFVTLYLSPRDYHRIHIPIAATLRRIYRVAGAYFPVNQRGIKAIPGLYIKNERVVAFLQSVKGLYAMVPVGATVVGSIQWHTAESYRQGEEFGWFEMGSTVILIFERGMVEFNIKKGDYIKARAAIGVAK